MNLTPVKQNLAMECTTSRVFKNYFLLLFVIFGFSNCSNNSDYPKEVLLTLKLADSNSTELRKVLDYYKFNNENPLKYKAACFLISNMQDHASQKLPGTIPLSVKKSYRFLDSITKATFFTNRDDQLFDLADYLNGKLDTKDFLPTREIIDSLVIWKFGKSEKNQKLQQKARWFQEKSDSIRDMLLIDSNLIQPIAGPVFDAKVMKATWLIRHIENAFEMWHHSPYAKNMKFDEFSETLLTYRSFGEDLDLDFPSDSCRKTMQTIVNYNIKDIGEIIKLLNFYIYAMDCLEDNGRNLGYLGFYDVIQFYKYDCDRHSEWTVKVLNACGIPATIDFTSGFFIRDKMHFGVSVRDSTGKYHHFSPKWQQIDDTAHSKLFSKVFRNTFSSQKNAPAFLKQKSEEVPPIFSDAHLTDVTEAFHETSNVLMKCERIPQGRNFGYIAIFTPKGWKPIGWGLVNYKEQSILFEKIPKDAMYIAGFYINGSLKPCSQPFYVDSQGGISFIKPNYQITQSLHLLRKYPVKPHLVAHMLDMVGSRIEVANKIDFSDALLLHTLEYSDLRDFGIKAINVNRIKKYRYLRIIPPKGKMLNIALIEIFSKSKPGERMPASALPYILYPQDTLGQSNDGIKKIHFGFLPNSQNMNNVSDENMESFVTTTRLGIDLNKPQEIVQIRIAPRNANNGIVVGNTYKLYYFDREWKEKHLQIARYNYLEFEGLPTGTIYWLQNLKGGKEELPFIYSNNRQVFLNNNELIESFGNSTF